MIAYVALVLIGSAGLSILFGKAMRFADEREPRPDWPDYLADIDLTPDRGDAPIGDNRNVNQALATCDAGPSPEFIARTRRLVVDELAQRRQPQS